MGKSYKNATIKDIMNAINNSDAGVKIQYDSLNDKFIFNVKVEGEASSITFGTHVDEENGLLKALGIVEGTYTRNRCGVYIKWR